MTFDHPRLLLFGHHPLGARTRYLLLTLIASPLLLVLPRHDTDRDTWQRNFDSLRGLP